MDEVVDRAVMEPDSIERFAIGFSNDIHEDFRTQRIKVVLEVDAEEGVEIIVISLAGSDP